MRAKLHVIVELQMKSA